MLALTRKKDEAIVIGGEIKIRVLGIQGDKVKLGIEAPKECSIYREEIYLQVSQSNKAAVQEVDIDLMKLSELFNIK
ncbi:MAG: carbon storage regulator CsrA [Cellulosilyticum sp.]|nr:carbon storage regulator CsrA [Cellulosilyticum sp.]